MKNMLNNKSLLITGGTGTLGKALVERILKIYPNIGRLIIFSRDEQKQYEMSQKFSTNKFPAMRYFLGDVRDKNRLVRALKGVDYVIHTAAIKHVHISEYNPDECIKTNIGGAENLVSACLDSNVTGVVSLSTDKACAPINLYGATKLTSDKLFVAANNFKGLNPIKFSVVRYGNVMGSKGSVIPFFIKKSKEGILPITDERMTRFNITLSESVDLVLFALKNAWGGEIFVPKIPSYNILDLAKAVCDKCKLETVGVRPGEKIHEEMISSSDSYSTYDIGKYYVILPYQFNWDFFKYKELFNAIKVNDGFSYNSKENSRFLKINELKTLINQIESN